MDCPRIGDQHHTEFDGADTEISDSRTVVGIGWENEETEIKTTGIAQRA